MKNPYTPPIYWIIILAIVFLVRAAFPSLEVSKTWPVCANGEGNIFNATLIVETTAPFEVVGDIGCVGQSITGDPYSYATIWADDPLTPEIDGLKEGDTFSIEPFPFPMEIDAIYIMKSTAADTTFSAIMDSLISELSSLSLVLDSTMGANTIEIASITVDRDLWITTASRYRVSRDSLQVIVDTFPDITALRDSLFIANSRVTELESDLSQANLQFIDLIGRIRSMMDSLRGINQ